MGGNNATLEPFLHHRLSLKVFLFVVLITIFLISIPFDLIIDRAFGCSWGRDRTTTLVWLNEDEYFFDDSLNVSRTGVLHRIKRNVVSTNTTYYYSTFYGLGGDFSLSPDGKYLGCAE